MTDSVGDGPLPSDDNVLSAALLGYGLAGSAFHGPVIGATPGIRVTAVVTSDPGRAEAARQAHPGVRVLSDADQLWTRAASLDLVVVATPNRTHVDLARAALRAGLHVVVDKPLAATSRAARALVAEARERGRILTVYQNRRWDGDFRTLQRLVADGRLGRVYRFESRFERWRPTPKPGWRQDPDPAAAGGLLYDLGAHLIDQALVLFGPVRGVHAELARRRPGAPVDDDTFLALEHESGVRSHLWMNAISARPGPRFRVLGSGGSWVKHGLDVQEAALRAGERPGGPGWGMDPEARWGTLYDGHEAHTTPPDAGDYTAFYAGLRDAIREDRPPPVDPVDALAVLEIIERARRSAGLEGADG